MLRLKRLELQGFKSFCDRTELRFNGGGIAAIQDGDTVTIDVAKRQLNLEQPAAEIARRLKAWRPPEPRYPTGVFAKYAALVSSASEGAITRPPR